MQNKHMYDEIAKDRRGVTLVEVMIALVITLVLFLSLMQTALVAIQSNTRNSLRDEAVRIASERMNEARAMRFADVVSDAAAFGVGDDCHADFEADFPNGEVVPRDVRSITSKDFCTNMTVTDLDADHKQVQITVGWTWRVGGGPLEDLRHQIISTRRLP